MGTPRDGNPCAGRYAGCTADPGDGARMCENCRGEHNRRAAARRSELRAAGRCVVCSARAVKGLTTCAAHREYYRARAAGD